MSSQLCRYECRCGMARSIALLLAIFCCIWLMEPVKCQWAVASALILLILAIEFLAILEKHFFNRRSSSP